MVRNTPLKVNNYIHNHRKHMIWRHLIQGAAVVVAFITLYLLIMPAITAERQGTILACPLEVHAHTEECYDAEGNLTCGETDYVLHTHGEECYQDGGLVCVLPEITEPKQEGENPPVHVHDAGCFIAIQGEGEGGGGQPPAGPVYTCGKENHTHTVECETDGVPKCGKEEHGHSVGCLGLGDPINLKDYPDVDLTLELRDSSDNLIMPNEGGIYPGVAGDNYKFKLTMRALFFLPGEYRYQLPQQAIVKDAQSGDIDYIDVKGTEKIGEYFIDTSGLVRIIFQEEATRYQNVVGIINCNVSFVVDADEPADPELTKEGTFDPEDGLFHFTLEATIPAYNAEVNPQQQQWRIWDYRTAPTFRAINLADPKYKTVVKLQYGGDIYDVPSIDNIDANNTTSAEIAYLSYLDSDDYYYFYLVRKDCDCVAGNCVYCAGEEPCNLERFGYNDPKYRGWCACWNVNRNATLTITYVDKDHQSYFHVTNKFYRNTAHLSSENDPYSEVWSDVNVPVPNLIQKRSQSSGTLNSNNDYAASYTITVNAGRIDLSLVDSDLNGEPDGEILIEDSMTSLTYVPGTMEIQRNGVSMNGDTVQDTIVYGNSGYTLEYTKDSEDPKKSLLNICLHEEVLGPYTYTITYQAQVQATMEEGAYGRVQTSNNATLKIYNLPSEDASKTYTFSSGWKYRRFELTMTKTSLNEWISEGRRLPLSGAIYGLYTKDGYRIAGGLTGEQGTCLFETNTVNGIIFCEDTIYYLKEEKAPPGYNVDPEPRKFYFSDTRNAELEAQGAEKVELLGSIEVSDTKGNILPATGSIGIYKYTLGGVLLMTVSAVCLMYRITRRGRRPV